MRPLDLIAKTPWNAFEFIGNEVIEGIPVRRFKLWVTHHAPASAHAKASNSSNPTNSSAEAGEATTHAVDYWDADCNIGGSSPDKASSPSPASAAAADADQHRHSGAGCRRPFRFDLVHPDIGRIIILVTGFELHPNEPDLKPPFESAIMAKSCVFESRVPAMVSPFDSVPFVAPAAGSPELAALLKPATEVTEVSLQEAKTMFGINPTLTSASSASNITAGEGDNTSGLGSQRRNLLDTTISFNVPPCSASASFGSSGLPNSYNLQCSVQISYMYLTGEPCTNSDIFFKNVTLLTTRHGCMIGRLDSDCGFGCHQAMAVSKGILG